MRPFPTTTYALVATRDPDDANLDVSNGVSIWWTVFPLTGPGRGRGLERRVETIIRVYDPLKPPAGAGQGPGARLQTPGPASQAAAK